MAVGGEPANFVEAVQKWTNGAGVDVILDLVGGNYFAPNLDVLASRGRLICVGTTAGAKSEIDLGLLMRKRATIIGTMLRRRSIEEKAEATRRFASSVLPLMARLSSNRNPRRACTYGIQRQLWQNRADIRLTN
jgi:NADPH:quinone reductase-like Zn-dependent oxidoreductase